MKRKSAVCEFPDNLMRREKISGPNCEKKATVSSRGNTDRNLNTANIPAAGGYSVKSLHGAPLSCLAFEDKAWDIKETVC